MNGQLFIRLFRMASLIMLLVAVALLVGHHHHALRHSWR